MYMGNFIILMYMGDMVILVAIGALVLLNGPTKNQVNQINEGARSIKHLVMKLEECIKHLNISD